MKAIGIDIFCGSQTIGHKMEGWEIDRVLEISDEMRNQNAYHFIKNYDIPVIDRSDWENNLDQYKGQYDLLFSNPPCSGLSAINRNAKVENDINKNIYEVANVINTIEPKAFLIENAPTLVNLGLPILKDVHLILGNKYRLTIITDLAGNHKVPMHRKRTLVVGWSKNEFEKMPIIRSQQSPLYTVGEALAGLDDSCSNMTPVELNDKYDFSRFYKMVAPGDTVVKTLCMNLDSIKDQLTDDELRLVERTKEKYDKGGSVWDKSPLRLEAGGRAPSITSVNRYIHPTLNRDLYEREYARLMGYPDDFKFYDGCQVSTIQCIAQGVPVNFIRYISQEIQLQFKNKVFYDKDCDVMYINQANGLQKITTFTADEFQGCRKIDRNDRLVREESLW